MDLGQPIDRTKGGLNRKFQAISDVDSPFSLLITAGEISDYIGAAALLDNLPKARRLRGGRAYGADCFQEALQVRRIEACIPGRRTRGKTIEFIKLRYVGRSRSEMMFGRLKDWPL